MEEKVYTAQFGGRPLTVKVGRLAQQANGSVVVQYGETVVLATAVLGSPTDRDYFPLSVDFEEKYYAAGKIKDSKWLKREGRPNEEAILTARVIDRSIRPRFSHNVRNEVQCVATVLAFDKENDADMPALFATSLALLISDIPFAGPVSGARVGRVDGKLVINPTYAERAKSEMDIIVSGTTTRINMIEAGANIVAEQIVGDAIEFAFTELQELNRLQETIAKDLGKPKQDLAVFVNDQSLVKLVQEHCIPRLDTEIFVPTKTEHYANQAAIKESALELVRSTYASDPELDKKLMETEGIFEECVNQVVHQNVLKHDKRVDGRKLDQLRKLNADVQILPRVHGSAIFERGETQALSVLTLAAPGQELWMESMEIDLTKKHFMHHYNFPPFSVGETGRMGAPGRREIGHGALAERALNPIIPSRDAFPYTVRVVSEIMGSNGSSSMASVCGASLALMDGGVPIKSPAAGIAMGIMFDDEGKNYKILTDIQGPEDHHGDMDLKVAGTKDGVTAMQMDVKVEGITPQIVRETLIQAKAARLEILGTITSAIAAPRADMSQYAPRVQVIKIDPSMIGLVIGSGGKTINGIIEETGATIDIEEDGTVFIACVSAEGMKKAIARIESLTYEPKPGDEMDGTIVSVKDFGAFVEIAPGRDGMVHVSEMSQERIAHPSDVVHEGQVVHVWVQQVSPDGKIGLSMLGPNAKQRPGR
jgi:polyribonucleotide nucleotidyltransferase